MKRFLLLACAASLGQYALSFPFFFPGRRISSNAHMLHNGLDGGSGYHSPEDISVMQAQEHWRRKAYDDWREEFGKGDFDPVRYESFKKNFITLMQANAAASNSARLQGEAEPELQKLNEYGDCTLEEYEAIVNGIGPKPTQPEESNSVAQKDAGYEQNLIETDQSIAIASDQNYSPQATQNSEGPQYVTSDSYNDKEVVDEEALQVSFEDYEDFLRKSSRDRIEETYISWCKWHGKEYDKSRLRSFALNFLDAEEHFRKTGEVKKLDNFADLPPEEFKASQSQDRLLIGTSRSRLGEAIGNKTRKNKPKIDQGSVGQNARDVSLVDADSVANIEEKDSTIEVLESEHQSGEREDLLEKVKEETSPVQGVNLTEKNIKSRMDQKVDSGSSVPKGRDISLAGNYQVSNATGNGSRMKVHGKNSRQAKESKVLSGNVKDKAPSVIDVERVFKEARIKAEKNSILKAETEGFKERLEVIENKLRGVRVGANAGMILEGENLEESIEQALLKSTSNAEKEPKSRSEGARLQAHLEAIEEDFEETIANAEVELLQRNNEARTNAKAAEIQRAAEEAKSKSEEEEKQTMMEEEAKKWFESITIDAEGEEPITVEVEKEHTQSSFVDIEQHNLKYNLADIEQKASQSKAIAIQQQPLNHNIVAFQQQPMQSNLIHIEKQYQDIELQRRHNDLVKRIDDGVLVPATDIKRILTMIGTLLFLNLALTSGGMLVGILFLKAS